MASNSMTANTNGENISSLEGKKTFMTERLQKREAERIAVVQKRKDDKSNTVSVQENAAFFAKSFTQGKSNLEQELAACDSLDKNRLVDKFDAISIMHQKLQKFVGESTMFLPSYEVRQALDSLNQLQTSIQEKRDLLIPKKKFGFASKKRGTVEAKPAEIRVGTIDAEDTKVKLADCKFIDMNNKVLEMNEDQTMQKDVALARLESCTVNLYGSPSAIHINKLNNCKIFSGPVSGSIFIRECKNCVFVVPCQQLRIHSTTESQFYIHVTSRAIIEDCNKVEFGPFNWDYPQIADHYLVSGLDLNRNSWDDIDDFNWLAADKRSPNWSLIPDDQQVKKW